MSAWESLRPDQREPIGRSVAARVRRFRDQVAREEQDIERFRHVLANAEMALAVSRDTLRAAEETAATLGVPIADECASSPKY